MTARRTAPWLAALWVAALILGCDRQPTRPAAASSPSLPTGASPSSAGAGSSTTAPADEGGAGSSGRTAAGVHYVEVLTAGAAVTDALPMIIAIHGLGDRPERFAWLLRDLPVPARVIVPQGLDPWHDGYSWFPIRVWNPDPKRIAEGMRRASNALAKAIADLQARHQAPDKVIVTGFSQGGMLSFALAVDHPKLVAAAFPLAGWLPESLAPTGPPQADSPPILAFHGVDDDLLPIEPTRNLVRSMDKLGFHVRLREFEHTGHSVSPDIRHRLLQRIAETLQGPAASSPSSTAIPISPPGE